MRKLGKFLLIVAAILGVAGVIAHLSWKYSGSGEWELWREKNGIRIWTLKEPGATVKRFKGTVRVNSTLATAYEMMQDPGICGYHNFGCYDAKVIERVDERLQFYTFRWKYPMRFDPREFVFKQEFSVVPETNSLLVKVIATPDRLPANDCCVRITDMDNSWRFTPVGDKQLDVEYLIDMNGGGFFPYFLSNLGSPRFMHFALSKVQPLLDREEYQNAPAFALQGN